MIKKPLTEVGVTLLGLAIIYIQWGNWTFVALIILIVAMVDITTFVDRKKI